MEGWSVRAWGEGSINLLSSLAYHSRIMIVDGHELYAPPPFPSKPHLPA